MHFVAKYNALHEKVKCNCTCREPTEQLKLLPHYCTELLDGKKTTTKHPWA